MRPWMETDLLLLQESKFFKEFIAERDEILRHKWLESEKAGHDVGFEKALLDWVIHHRSCWLDRRKRASLPPGNRKMATDSDGGETNAVPDLQRPN